MLDENTNTREGPRCEVRVWEGKWGQIRCVKQWIEEDSWCTPKPSYSTSPANTT